MTLSCGLGHFLGSQYLLFLGTVFRKLTTGRPQRIGHGIHHGLPHGLPHVLSLPIMFDYFIKFGNRTRNKCDSENGAVCIIHRINAILRAFTSPLSYRNGIDLLSNFYQEVWLSNLKSNSIPRLHAIVIENHTAVESCSS